MPQATTFTFTDPDGFRIFVRQWSPDAHAKAVVQIAHGAAEHSLRYERFATFLNAAGYLVYANDHRGHGQTAHTVEQLGMAGDDGWNGIIADAKQLTDLIQQTHPNQPVFLFGHSLGSLLAQQYMQRWGAGLRGVVLSGAFGVRPNLDEAIAQVTAQPREARAPGLSSRFAQEGQHPFAWLTRDKAEAQKYMDDPRCGFPFAYGLTADYLKGVREAWQPENEARIPKTLPIFFIAGDQDPVGGRQASSVHALLQRYQALGIHDVQAKIYAGARHEILNEINREEVQADVLAWLTAHLISH
jgi:alpha-beta hydrolase superfamily lysophospholipase